MQRFSAITSRALSDPNLSDSEYRTLGAIATHADKDGWCYPSQSLLAEIRGVSRQTINSHIKKLAALGYLNIEPRYRDDGGQTSNMMQVRLDFSLEDLTGGVKSMALQGVSSQDLTGGVKSGFDTNTAEETPTEEIQKNNDNGAFSEVVLAYENNIGMITPIVSDSIQNAVAEYPDGWILDAISIAAESNKRNWKYINGILRNWHSNGRQDTKTIRASNQKSKGWHPV